MREWTRREWLGLGAGAGAGLALGVWTPWNRGPVAPPPRAGQLRTRAIPSSGEELPVVGIGMRNYRTAWAEDGIDRYRRTLRVFHRLGGQVLDTAPSYGDSESVLGQILEDLGIRDDLFIATKVDRAGRQPGIRRMEGSFRRIGVDGIDLMQVHNLRDARTQLETLRQWKAEGRIRYVGVTTSRDSQYEALGTLMEEEQMDFVQVDYNLGDRSAADRILPLARDRGQAVLVNRPFGRGALFEAAGERPLPGWASGLDAESWAQLFLKYVLGHPAVTVVIPGTTEPGHARDNLGAARGALPDAGTRRRMERLYDAF